MGRYIIKPENQLQRLNSLSKEIEALKSLDAKILTAIPAEKAWSVIEVVEHMVRGHADYREKIDGTTAKLEPAEVHEEIQSRWMPSFLIKRFPPKEGKIRFKMKTMKRFQPVLDVSEMSAEDLDEVFAKFEDSIKHVNQAVIDYRTKNVTSIIFNSAVGSWVKFNVAEACEFIICHNERHLQQIKNTLKKVEKRP